MAHITTKMIHGALSPSHKSQGFANTTYFQTQPSRCGNFHTQRLTLESTTENKQV